ncbi:MAG: glycosyltransferase family 39 protein [Chloroflexota bacterium]
MAIFATRWPGAYNGVRRASTGKAAGTLLATYVLARGVTRRHDVALAAAGIASFTPGFAFISATVNNDNGVALLSSLLLLHCVGLAYRGAPTWRDGGVGGVLLGAAALTKLSGLQLAGVLALWPDRHWPGVCPRACLSSTRPGLC